MRLALPYVLAAVLGVGCAALAACGGSGDRSALIPQRSADRLKSALSDVRSAVHDHECETAARAIARARGALVNLPPSVDDRLVARLRQGIDNLQQVAPRECQQQDTTPTESTTETTPTPTTTETTPTETTPTDTTPTNTTPTTTTTTTPQTTTTTAPTTSTPAAPPADTTGGTGTP